MKKNYLTIAVIVAAFVLFAGCTKKDSTKEMKKCLVDGVTLELNGQIEKAVEKYAEGYRIYDSIPSDKRNFEQWETGIYFQYLLQIISAEDFAKNAYNVTKTKILSSKDMTDVQKADFIALLSEDAFLPKSRTDVLNALSKQK